MFEISEFTLFEKGYSGLEAKLRAYYEDDKGRTIRETGSRKRETPISKDLRISVNQLKKFYLTLTGHWILPFNDYFDEELNEPRIPGESEKYNGPWLILADLWKKTTITGAVTKDDGGFILKGYLEIIDKKPLNISTPLVKMTDDYGLFHQTMNTLGEIATHVISYFTEGLSLAEPKETIKALGGFEGEDLDTLTEEELENELINILEKRGAVMLKDTDTAKIEKSKKPKKDKATASDKIQEKIDVESKALIDPVESSPDLTPTSEQSADEIPDPNDHIPEAQEIKPGESLGITVPDDAQDPVTLIPAEETGEVVGNNTIDNNIPEANDLSRFEHSENMGPEASLPNEDNQGQW